MTKIYDQHKAAFAQVEAFVVLKDGERVATIAFKFPRDGAGRLYAYVHWLGLEMARGFAGGGGYDKRSAACADAVKRIKAPADTAENKGFPHASFKRFLFALAKDEMWSFDRAMREAGFQIVQAV